MATRVSEQQQEIQETNPVSDDSGAVKISYDVEDDSKPSAFQRLKDKFTHSNTKQEEPKNESSGVNSSEAAYHLAAAADTPEQTKLPGLNIRQSAGGTQEISTTHGGSPSEGAKLASGLNIRQSAGGTQEIHTPDGGSPSEEVQREKKKVSRGEELGTGYESDSESSGLA